MNPLPSWSNTYSLNKIGVKYVDPMPLRRERCAIKAGPAEDACHGALLLTPPTGTGMKPRHLSRICGGPHSVDTRSRTHSLLLCSPPVPSSSLSILASNSAHHDDPTCPSGKNTSCTSASLLILVFLITHNTHKLVPALLLTSFRLCLCPAYVHHNKPSPQPSQRCNYLCNRYSMNYVPCWLHLTHAQPFPHSCPCVRKTRRTNPEYSEVCRRNMLC